MNILKHGESWFAEHITHSTHRVGFWGRHIHTFNSHDLMISKKGNKLYKRTIYPAGRCDTPYWIRFACDKLIWQQWLFRVAQEDFFEGYTPRYWMTHTILDIVRVWQPWFLRVKFKKEHSKTKPSLGCPQNQTRDNGVLKRLFVGYITEYISIRTPP